MVTEITVDLLKKYIRNISDFPRPGIQFKDITTILKQPELFAFAVDEISSVFSDKGITRVVCIESRGFMLGGAIAYRLGAGFVPIRKSGKLPAKTYSVKYALEYGSDSMEIHRDAITPGEALLIHDDLLATGGTARASIELLHFLRPEKIYLSFLCELEYLHGRDKLKEFEVHSLIQLKS